MKQFFINYEDITDEVTIDCRTEEEFYLMPLFKYNIPIITKRTHTLIKKFYPSALFIIIYCRYRDRKRLRSQLNVYSKSGSKPVIIGCSRGRLRSPILCIFARHMGIDAKVLRKGLKRFFR